ncbi:MAG: ABC transporter permease subunit [Planctomycetota bacterium]
MIAAKCWREMRLYALLYVVLLGGLLGLALLFWPDAREKLVEKGGQFEFLAPMQALKDFFKDAASRLEPAAFAAYVGVQQFFKGVNIVGVACAVLMGCSTIAKERERGTFELLASRPVSRGRILWSTTWVLALILVVPVFASSLLVLPYARAQGYELPVGGLLQASLHSSLFVLLFLGLTLLGSVLLRTQVEVATAIGAFVILQVGIYFVPVVQHGSLFRLTDYDVYRPMVPGNLDWTGFLLGTEVWLVLAVVGVWLLAFTLFRRRDL